MLSCFRPPPDKRHHLEHRGGHRIARVRILGDQTDDPDCGDGQREHREQHVEGDRGRELRAVVGAELTHRAADQSQRLLKPAGVGRPPGEG